MKGDTVRCWYLLLVLIATVNCLKGSKGGGSRLPRTSAGQLAAAAAAQNKTVHELRNARNSTLTSTVAPPPGRRSSSRER
nr:unnamed protein product [Callosobruchus analis]